MRIAKWRSGLSSLLAATLTVSLFVGTTSAATTAASPDILSDVPAANWAYPSIHRWQQDGIIHGYPDGTFRPAGQITRAEFAVIANRLFGFQEETTVRITDIKPGNWAYREIAKAVEVQYLALNPQDQAYPNQPLTRGEAANALAALFHLHTGSDVNDTTTFRDLTNVAPDVRQAIAALEDAGFLAGYPDGTFRPEKTITRAEMASLLDRMAASLISKPGKDVPAQVAGNVIVNAPGVSVGHTTIQGNLYLAPGIGDGNVRLEKVTVEGTAYINGGGEHTVTVADSTLGDVQVDKQDGKVRVLAIGNTTIGHLTLVSGAILEGPFGLVTVSPPSDGTELPVITIRGTVTELVIDRPVRILLADDAVIRSLSLVESARGTSLQGGGKVEKIDNQAADVTLNGKPLESAAPTPSGGSSGSSTPPVSQNPWTLVWSDEFNGDAIDTSKWGFDTTNGVSVGNPGWGNNELEYYTDRSDNAKVEDGKLVITARKEDYEGFHYTSARMKTAGKFSKTYGKFEIRAKAPTGQGLWPAIWMMPEDSVYGVWASSGEIDIMEGWGSKPDRIGGTIHYGGQWPNNVYTGKEYTFTGSTTAEWHTYALEWEPGEIRWYVDGKLFSTQNDWYSKGADQPANYAYPAPFDQAFHLIVNLAVGGNFDGNPADDSIFPSTMEIDYVRVYDLTGRAYREPTPPASTQEAYPAGARLPLPDGNLVYNNDFTQVVDDDADMGIPGTAYWALFQGEGGAATVSIDPLDGVNFAKIAIAAGGSQFYSVQPQAIVSLAKGRTYKLTFDAKSDASRSMTVRLTGGASRGFAAYSQSLTAALTDSIGHYELLFQMKQDSDPAARVEFNMGLDTHPVWIGNARLVEIDAIPFEHDAEKVPYGPDGNHVYNGTFDQGETNRLSYWHLLTSGGASATAAVDANERKLKLGIASGGTSPEQVQLVQKGIQLIQDQQYRLTLDGSAAPARDIEVALVNHDGSEVYDVQSVHMTGAASPAAVSFTMTGSTTHEAQLVLRVGGAVGTILLDNIKLVRTSDYLDPGVVKFPLVNGQFDGGMTPWQSVGIEGATVTSQVYRSQAAMSIGAVGPNPWSVMLLQDGLSVSNGVRYTVEFDARSTETRAMEVILENASYQRSFDQTVELTPDMRRYRFEFAKSGDETVSLKFLLGNIAGSSSLPGHDVFIDNVVVEPALAVTLGNKLINGTFDDDAIGWTSFFADFQGVVGSVGSAEGTMKTSLNETGTDNWSAQVDYENVAIEAGKSYRLLFDAKSSIDRSIQVTVEHKGGAYDKYLDVRKEDVTSEWRTFGYTFTAGATDSGAHVNFLFGAIDGAVIADPHDIYIDNVSLVEVPMPALVGHGILNGTFDVNTDEWGLITSDGSNAAIRVDNEQLLVDFTTYDGWFQWSTIVRQGGLQLESGKSYTFSFDASSTLSKPVMVEIKQSGSGFHLETKTITLTEEMNDYSWTFTVSGDTDPNALLQFHLGSDNVDGELFIPHSIRIDNVTLTED